MLTLNDYQALANSFAADPHERLFGMLRFLGMDAPAADVLAYQLTAMSAPEGEPQPMRLLVGAVGAAGEAGELLDHVKKVAGHGHDLDRSYLVKEIGDVLWYCAELAGALGVSLDEIAQVNLDKLRARYPHGFSSEASRNRAA